MQSYCANMNFGEKSDMIGFLRKLHIKEGNKQGFTSRYSKIHRLYQFQWETVIMRINSCISSWITYTSQGGKYSAKRAGYQAELTREETFT